MANILIYDVGTGEVQKIIPSAHTPEYSDRSDVLVNPDLLGLNIADMIVENSAVREMTQAEKDARDSALLADQQAAEAAQYMNISFEDMPMKLPGLAWMIIEAIGFTEDEKDIVILSLGDFHKYLNAGYVVRGVTRLNEMATPEGVDATRWGALLSQVNQIVG